MRRLFCYWNKAEPKYKVAIRHNSSSINTWIKISYWVINHLIIWNKKLQPTGIIPRNSSKTTISNFPPPGQSPLWHQKVMDRSPCRTTFRGHFFPFCLNFCPSGQVKNSYPRSKLSELKRNQSKEKLEISTYPHTSNQFFRMAYMKSILIFFRFGIDIWELSLTCKLKLSTFPQLIITGS